MKSIRDESALAAALEQSSPSLSQQSAQQKRARPVRLESDSEEERKLGKRKSPAFHDDDGGNNVHEENFVVVDDGDDDELVEVKWEVMSGKPASQGGEEKPGNSKEKLGKQLPKKETAVEERILPLKLDLSSSMQDDDDEDGGGEDDGNVEKAKKQNENEKGRRVQKINDDAGNEEDDDNDVDDMNDIDADDDDDGDDDDDDDGDDDGAAGSNNDDDDGDDNDDDDEEEEMVEEALKWSGKKSAVGNGKHLKQKALVLKQAAEQFDLWVNLMSQGFSVILCGVGSKFELLQQFAVKVMSKELPCIVVKGFTCHTKGVDLCRDIVDKLAEHLGCSTLVERVKGPFERWKSIALRLSEKREQHSSSENEDDPDDFDKEVAMDFLSLRPAVISSPNRSLAPERREACKRVCIVVHSIDGLELRSPEVQALLCDIASTPEVQMIASVDDVNMQTMWSREMLERFRWWWVAVNTFQVYSTEDTMAKMATVKRTVATTEEKIERLVTLLRSLSQKHQVMTLALCNLQLDVAASGAKRNDVWVTKKSWSEAEGVQTIQFGRIAQMLLKELLQSGMLEQKSRTEESYRLRNFNNAELKRLRDQIQRLVNKED